MCHVRRTAYATVVSHTAVRVVDMLNAYSHDDAEPLATDIAEIISPLSHAVDQSQSVRDHAIRNDDALLVSVGGDASSLNGCISCCGTSATITKRCEHRRTRAAEMPYSLVVGWPRQACDDARWPRSTAGVRLSAAPRRVVDLTELGDWNRARRWLLNAQGCSLAGAERNQFPTASAGNAIPNCRTTEAIDPQVNPLSPADTKGRTPGRPSLGYALFGAA